MIHILIVTRREEVEEDNIMTITRLVLTRLSFNWFVVDNTKSEIILWQE